MESKDTLAALRFSASFVTTGAENFWASADPIMQTVKFNAIVFCVSFLLVLAMTVFLFLRQRSRDYAIQRTLGCSAMAGSRQLLGSVLAFSVPAEIVGGVLAWQFALRQVEKTLNPLSAGIAEHGAAEFSISILFVAAIMVALLAIILAMALIGVTKISRRSVLEMLQGSGSKMRKGGI